MRIRSFRGKEHKQRYVEKLGRGYLPIEVSPEDHVKAASEIEKLGCKAELRIEDNGEIFETDNNNYIYHCKFPEGIDNPKQLDEKLLNINGVKDTGLFLDMATKVIIGSENGTRILE